jgi:trans-2,3-dihydro-3-hydroxyanthranilate isomerase
MMAAVVALPFRLLDVFTDGPFTGNQLCVCPDAAGLDPATMQTLAAEIGFSETTFVTEVRRDRYAARIFTPEAELPFAGHPTLGTAFALVSEGRVAPSCVQECAAGEIPVEVDLEAGRAVMRQLPASFGPRVLDRDAVAGAIGVSPDDLDTHLPATVGSTGLRHLLVPLGSASAVRGARRLPDRVRALAESVGAEGVYLFAGRPPETITARFFDRGEGVGEDAATGSAAGPLGAYLASYAGPGPTKVLIRQGVEIGRPSLLEVESDPEGRAVFVSGAVRLVGRGEFVLPA